MKWLSFGIGRFKFQSKYLVSKAYILLNLATVVENFAKLPLNIKTLPKFPHYIVLQITKPQNLIPTEINYWTINNYDPALH